MMNEDALIKTIEKIADHLTQNNKYLCVAESCTGGWVAKMLTDLAGSSNWFERGFVTYSNRSKHEMLGVFESTLQTYGAVSEETVNEMAVGALFNSHADYSIAISGIAGPGGGTDEKPVGLVWFAWAKKDSDTYSAMLAEKIIFSGDRNAVRQQAVTHALEKLLHLMTDKNA